MNEWLSLLLSWFPFLVLIVLWVWVSRSIGMRARSPSGVTMIELCERQAEEMRQINATLERNAAVDGEAPAAVAASLDRKTDSQPVRGLDPAAVSLARPGPHAGRRSSCYVPLSVPQLRAGRNRLIARIAGGGQHGQAQPRHQPAGAVSEAALARSIPRGRPKSLSVLPAVPARRVLAVVRPRHHHHRRRERHRQIDAARRHRRAIRL